MKHHPIGQELKLVLYRVWRIITDRLRASLMLLAMAHFFKCYNPKDFADFLGISQ